MNSADDCIDDFLNNYWHYVLNHDLDIFISSGSYNYILDVNGFTCIDENGIEYMMSEMSEFHKRIVARLLPDFKQKINTWVEN